MPLPPVPDDDPSADPLAGTTDPEEVPVDLDLLRADLYRLLDELVRARAEYHRRLVSEFEQAWEQFKDATARDA